MTIAGKSPGDLQRARGARYKNDTYVAKDQRRFHMHHHNCVCDVRSFQTYKPASTFDVAPLRLPGTEMTAEVPAPVQDTFGQCHWGDHISPPTSLHCALESSMRLWKQPSTGRGRQSSSSALFTANGGTGGSMAFVDSKLDAALDYSWSLPLDEQTSSSSGSNGSRTPSPQQSGSSSGYSSACSSTRSSSSFSPPPETYSRKVFVGGLPPDIDQDEIRDAFIQFGGLTVDWPHKAQSKAYFPPKGYAFLLFREEVSVHRLVKSCLSEEGKLYIFVSSLTQTNKKVQIRPWRLSDSDYIMDHTQPIDARKTIFIGGVPRPLKACELADIFNSRYGNVCYAGIDCDPDLKYPKGAGRVTLSLRVSFMSAVSCRFLQVTYGDIDKKVEVKPYILDDQVCVKCHGMNCGIRLSVRPHECRS